MKKIVIVVASFFAGIVVSQAQTEKGTLLLGGTVSFNSVEGSTSFVATPNVGVFIANKIAIGGRATIFTSDGSTNWSVGPFGRYYFTNNEKGKPFVGVNVGVGGEDGDTEFAYGASAGYAIFLNRSIALEFAVNYSRSDDVDVIGVGAGFQIHFHK